MLLVLRHLKLIRSVWYSARFRMEGRCEALNLRELFWCFKTPARGKPDRGFYRSLTNDNVAGGTNQGFLGSGKRNRYHGARSSADAHVYVHAKSCKIRDAFVMKFDGGYDAAQWRKIQSEGKRKLSIRDVVAYTVTSVYVSTMWTTKEWIIGIYGISYPMCDMKMCSRKSFFVIASYSLSNIHICAYLALTKASFLRGDII